MILTYKCSVTDKDFCKPKEDYSRVGSHSY